MLDRPPFPRPSAAAADKARRLLERALGPSKVITSAEGCLAYASDESDQDPVAPDAVVLASSADDIAKALAAASEAEVPIVPRAAGSGKSGGAVPVAGGIVLATLGMNHIKEIDRAEQLAVVEPGVVLADLHAAVEAEGLFYPPDPNSLKVCAIGGNIAENAGGPRAFKYGVTRAYVLGLEVLSMDGARLRTGRRTVKGVTGYDVTALLVGSEGTLAVTSEATLRLVPKPASVATLLALFADVASAGGAVAAILAAGVVPRCLELLDAATLQAVRDRGVGVDARARAMLLIEVDGDPAACDAAAQRVGEVCADSAALDVLAAQDPAQRDRLWEARRMLSPATRAMARFKISEDVVVPRTRIVDLLAEVDAIAESTGIRMLTYGHAGDGNLHVNYLWDDPESVPRVRVGLDRLFRAVIAMRGTLTGEHGIGTSKADYLSLEQGSALIDLQRRIKAVFDPKGLLNPHKKSSLAPATEPAEVRVLGIDPGSRHLGWGVVSRTGTRVEHVAHGVIDVNVDGAFADRLVEIDDALEQVIALHKPDIGAVESIFFSKDAQSAAKLGHARGVILLRLARAGIPIREYAPALVKRTIVGKGAADKRQVAMVMTAVLRLPKPPRADAADALAVAMTHVHVASFEAALAASRQR